MLKYTSNSDISTGKGTNIFQNPYRSVSGNRLRVQALSKMVGILNDQIVQTIHY